MTSKTQVEIIIIKIGRHYQVKLIFVMKIGNEIVSRGGHIKLFLLLAISLMIVIGPD